MVEYTSSANGPKGVAVIEAVQKAVLEDISLSDQFKSSFQEYITSLRNSPALNSKVPLPPSEVLRYNQLEDQVKDILHEHSEKSEYLLRFKRPTGSESAQIGNLIFFPPPSNKDSNRDTLVRGPDTTFRMLEAHLSDIGLFTMDLYPFSTKLPRHGQGCSAFKYDDTFAHSDTAVKLWDLFYNHATQVYSQRATKQGVEVVWGRPVRIAYKSLTAEANLGGQWKWVSSNASVSMPSIRNRFGFFEAGKHEFAFVCLPLSFDWILVKLMRSVVVS